MVSPKLANSGVPEDVRLTDALAAFAALSSASFKLVVRHEADLAEVHALCTRFGIAPERVWLMPEGRTSAALKAGTPWVRAACERHGHRFSDRLHVHTHGDARGT